jgi:hypothetical protein
MLANLWARFRARVAPFYDPTAWTLIILCAGGVWLFDPVAAKTLVQWSLLFGVFAGLGVIISRHVLPQISLTAAVEKAMEDNPVAAGILVLAVSLFMSALVISLTMWGKA